MDASTTTLNVLDDNGNVWGCTLMVGNDEGPPFTIGGGWKRMVMARRLRQGSRIMLGAPMAGNNTTIYLRVIRHCIFMLSILASLPLLFFFFINNALMFSQEKCYFSCFLSCLFSVNGMVLY